MRVQVYKCRFTGALFQTKRKFAQHLKKLRKKQRTERELVRAERYFDEFFFNMRQTVGSVDELMEFIMVNWIRFCRNSVIRQRRIYWGERGRKVDEDLYPTLEDIRIQLSYVQKINNTHSCPKNGVINWLREPDKPLHYPGWSGQISYRLKYPGKEPDFMGFSSDMFRGTGIDIGSGSGSRDNFTYSLNLFYDDWPQMAKKVTFKFLNEKERGVHPI